MRNESIGDYSWDSSASGVNSGNGENEWPEADAMKLLNPGYESETIGGSLYYNSKSGKCYNNSKNATTSCDFTSSGIKNEETKNKIAEVTWNLGGWNTSKIFSNQIYGSERGTTVYSGRSTTWPGKVALPYPSDYGYATDFNKCSKNLLDYGGVLTSNDCGKNDWMYPIITSGWLLTSHSSNAYNALYVRSSGDVNGTGDAYYAYGVAPVLYLSSDETIVDGTTGSQDNPYKLNP